MSIGRQIHEMIMREHGTLLHTQDRTFVVHIYNWNIKVQHDDDERSEAAKFFWNEIASKELKDLIKNHLAEFRDYCSERRREFSVDDRSDAGDLEPFIHQYRSLGSLPKPHRPGPNPSGAILSECHGVESV